MPTPAATQDIPTRAHLPVSLPVPNPTVSHWQTPPSRLSAHRSTPTLPAFADIVIVGSGISGAMVAWNLLKGAEGEGKRKRKVVMVEARGACSGATGRNGGHTKAASYRSFPTHLTAHSPATAARIARLELSNIRATHAFAAAHAIPCESAQRQTVDIIYSPTLFAEGKAAIAQMRDVLGMEDEAARYRVYEAEEARERFFARGTEVVVGGEGNGDGAGGECVGAFEYEAGSISGYAFVSGVLEMCVARGLELQTWTPVTGVEDADVGGGEESGDADGARWLVHTPRGTMRARDVVLTTNGYTANLLPELQARIVPLRGQVTAQRPGSKLPVLPTTYSFIYDGGYEYMVPRPADSAFPNDIVIGGGLGKLPNAGACEYGETDDGVVNEDVGRYLRKTTESYFGECWGEDEEERVRQEWTGVMGATVDGLPYVGPIPEKPGLWMSAGFNGHGMVLCLKCAEALTHVLLGGSKTALDWFPDSFWISPKRLTEGVFDGRLT